MALPPVLPGLAVTAVLTVFFSGEFVRPGAHRSADANAPIGRASSLGRFLSIGRLVRRAVTAMIPMLVIGLSSQRFLVRGLATGAVKGRRSSQRAASVVCCPPATIPPIVCPPVCPCSISPVEAHEQPPVSGLPLRHFPFTQPVPECCYVAVAARQYRRVPRALPDPR